MPKQITILDPNGVEVAQRSNADPEFTRYGLLDTGGWEDAVDVACEDLCNLLKCENPKLGTYTITVREVE